MKTCNFPSPCFYKNVGTVSYCNSTLFCEHQGNNFNITYSNNTEKYIFILLLLLSITTNGYCTIFGITDSIFKKQTNEIKNDLSAIKEMNLTANTRVGTLESKIDKLDLKLGQLNFDISAKVSGLDQSINSTIKSGRDTNTNTTNDTKLMQYIIKGLCGICATLMSIIFWTVKALFREMGNARFYQNNVAKLCKNGEFESIMEQKKKLDKQKHLLNKISNAKEILFKKKGDV